MGDSIQVRDNRTGLVITSTIAKKIVKVSRGVLSVDYEVGVASAKSYGGGASAETNLITPIANGGTGATNANDAASNLLGSKVYTNANKNLHIQTPLDSNNKWVDYSFERDGLWMRVYTGSGTSNPDGAWKCIASWT